MESGGGGHVIWINGPFGAGKTTVAHELGRRVPRSVIFDPEQAGFYLRRVQPKGLSTWDFQDDPLWRAINCAVLRDIAQRHPGPVLVPMTLRNPRYYDEIIGRLRKEGVRVDHYALVASPATLRHRLALRAEGPRSWAVRRIGPCLEALYAPPFEGRIKTDHLPIPLIARHIAARSGLAMEPVRGCVGYPLRGVALTLETAVKDRLRGLV